MAFHKLLTQRHRYAKERECI
uniref:Uncharacterized protein n=1 Tax=Heterorhabditis bacteriophora TaxID=37862 RepID=A0A1I7W856_HETBA